MNQPAVTFEQLTASRRQWIDEVLRPWCRQATRRQLMQAAAEWLDLAGRVDANATLWTWAWERFPELTHDDLVGVNETYQVHVTLRDGTTTEGFPDSRRSLNGQLFLVVRNQQSHAAEHSGPFSIDDITAVRLTDTQAEGS